MNITMYDTSVPILKQMLGTLSIILQKAEQHVLENKLNEKTILEASLFPDMYTFTRQIQMASDFAKAVAARLANIDIPSYPDVETTLSELMQRVEKTRHFVSSISQEKIIGCEKNQITVRPGTPREKNYQALPYLLHHALPQFFFHVTIAYAILRNSGVKIGKTDYMGIIM